jgi:hypothetical protein
MGRDRFVEACLASHLHQILEIELAASGSNRTFAEVLDRDGVRLAPPWVGA